MQSSRREFVLSYLAAAMAARVMSGEAANGAAQERWPSRFPALSQRVNGHPLTFLDSAATTLRPQSVIDALVDYSASSFGEVFREVSACITSFSAAPPNARSKNSPTMLRWVFSSVWRAR
jgi:hypothetical protein